MSKRSVAIVFPTMWDEVHLAACPRVQERYEIELVEPSDDDCPWDLDVLAFIDEVSEHCSGRVDGVTSSSDYPGATVAAAIATRLGLPGSRPANVIRCSHKFYSRRAQKDVVPEATADFCLVDPRRLEEGVPPDYPRFVKPVKGAFSVMSQKVRSRRELEEFLTRPSVAEFLSSYVSMFNRLVGELTDFDVDGSYFIAEELLKGKLVTLEGFVRGGTVSVLGIVDSIRHKGTGSFARFEYPSALPAAVQSRMGDVASRVISAIGLTDTMFNIEMMYDTSTERIAIVEINPRMCGQFADLYEKVDGTNGYEIALALAVGESPQIERRGGRYRAAASFPLRIFAPMEVVKTPGEVEMAKARDLFPGTLLWAECAAGDQLSDFQSVEDGKSARYGVVNLGAPHRDELVERRERVLECLDYRFRPL